MATVTLELRGDQIGRFTSSSGTGNGAERVLTVNGVEALGTHNQIYTVTVEQVHAGVTEFQNGQFITIHDSSGAIVVPRINVQPDIEQGLGAGDDHLLISRQNILIDLGGVPAGPATMTYTRADAMADVGAGDNDGNLDFADFPCFAPGTLIATPAGQKAVEDLAAGDLINTTDGGAIPVLWSGRRKVDLRQRAIGKPIRIKPGFAGSAGPQPELILSPDHRICLCDPACDLLFGTPEVLAPAKALVSMPRLHAMQGRKEIDYVSVLTSRHAVIIANGLPVKTLYPGPEALLRLGFFGRTKVFSVISGLRHQPVEAVYPPARRMLTVGEARTLASVLRLRWALNGETTEAPRTPHLRVV